METNESNLTIATLGKINFMSRKYNDLTNHMHAYIHDCQENLIIILN